MCRTTTPPPPPNVHNCMFPGNQGLGFEEGTTSSRVVSAHFFWSALCHPAAPALLQHSTAIVINFWELCNADYVWSVHGRRMTVIPTVCLSTHFFCTAKCHPPSCTLLQCPTAIVINSWDMLKLCLEALFGAQSRVALPHRACFQPLLSGCTILPIISCSSFARFKYLEVHTGRGAASVFVWHFQKSTAF